MLGPKPAGDALKILMAAGEVSGDMQGSFLAKALWARDDTLHIFGLGGARMKAAGVDLRIDATLFSTVGVIEALRFVAPLRRVLRRVQEMILVDRPDAAILIDNHGFNLMLAKFLKKHRIPVIYYFPPQAWVASSVFAGGVVRNSDLIISAFESEAAVYRQYGEGGRAVSVGHPLLDIVRPGPNADGVLERLGIDPSRPLMALMPGSRQQELDRLARPMFGAATMIKKEIPAMQFILPVAAAPLRSRLQAMQRECGCTAPIHFIETDVYTCLSRCNLLITSTGTATLEAALLGVPMVTAYRLNPFTVWLARLTSKARRIAMPNLLLEDDVVPEIIQRDVTAERLAEEALKILRSPSRQAAMRKRFRELPGILGKEGALDRIADLVLNELPARAHPCPVAA